MKFFRLDLLTLLISLFILNSCKNESTIGLGIKNAGQLSGALIDTSTIVVNTTYEDSVITSGLSKNPLSYFTDPVFGVTEASIATDLSLPGGGSYTPPTGTITIDSARLVLNFADGFYGDSITSSYKVNVYTLNEPFKDGTAYYNTKQWSVNTDNLIGSLTFSARTHDSIKVYNIIAGKPDTLIRVRPQIRIPILSSFINQNLFNANTTTLSSNSIFQSNVKGLYITLDKTKTTGPGGNIMIAKGDSIAVYYRAVNGANIDTAVVKLPIRNMAVNIKHTYTSTITNVINSKSTSNNLVYLQGTSGLRARVSFPNFLANLRGNLLKKDSDIVLNRAELVITPAPGSFIPYRPLPKLTMYRLDLAHQRISMQDGDPADTRYGGIYTFGGFYNSTKNQYHFIVTAYLQDLLLNKNISYGTYIAPIDTTNRSGVDILNTPQVAARTVAVGSDKSSANRIKLNIIYTKVAKQ